MANTALVRVELYISMTVEPGEDPEELINEMSLQDLMSRGSLNDIVKHYDGPA